MLTTTECRARGVEIDDVERGEKPPTDPTDDGKRTVTKSEMALDIESLASDLDALITIAQSMQDEVWGIVKITGESQERAARMLAGAAPWNEALGFALGEMFARIKALGEMAPQVADVMLKSKPRCGDAHASALRVDLADNGLYRIKATTEGGEVVLDASPRVFTKMWSEGAMLLSATERAIRERPSSN